MGSGNIFDIPKRLWSAGQQATLASAAKRARLLGFRIDVFELHSGTVDGRKLSRILQARGIQGIILPPMFDPGTFPEMDWARFSVTAIGYSIMEPVFHRVCPHQAHTLREELRELGALGYRRIGLAMAPNADTRTEHNFLGSYLAYQNSRLRAERLPPLIAAEFRKTEFRRWLTRHGPDCVLASEALWFEKLRAMGIAIPQELGFCILGQRQEYPELAGSDERMDTLGEVAVDINVALQAKGDKGIPDSPSTTLVEGGRWSPGTTVRPMHR